MRDIGTFTPAAAGRSFTFVLSSPYLKGLVAFSAVVGAGTYAIVDSTAAVAGWVILICGLPFALLATWAEADRQLLIRRPDDRP